MGNIVFDGLSALSFTKQLDEYGTEVILSMETIRHSVERVLRVYESNGATNDYLEETRKTLWDLQLDYGVFLDDFIATLKNIGDTYEKLIRGQLNLFQRMISIFLRNLLLILLIIL